MKHKCSKLSKSEQIISSVTESIRKGIYESGQVIPSINSSAKEFGVARKTVVRAYDKLKDFGLIESRPKQGYFVVDRTRRRKVLLLIHSFEGHWEVLYNRFRDLTLDYCDIELYFHHYNISVLEMIVSKGVDDYDFLIISSFYHPRLRPVVEIIPSSKLLFISRKDGLPDHYNYIIQDFEEGTKHALLDANHCLESYTIVNLVFPEEDGHCPSLKQGFRSYCEETNREAAILNSLKDHEIVKKQAYITVCENDLIYLLTVCKTRNWVLGQDIGVLAYNETPLKKVIRDGISVISCNFHLLASEMSKFIKSPQSIKQTIPTEFIERNSL